MLAFQSCQNFFYIFAFLLFCSVSMRKLEKWEMCLWECESGCASINSALCYQWEKENSSQKMAKVKGQRCELRKKEPPFGEQSKLVAYLLVSIGHVTAHQCPERHGPTLLSLACCTSLFTWNWLLFKQLRLPIQKDWDLIRRVWAPLGKNGSSINWQLFVCQSESQTAAIKSN